MFKNPHAACSWQEYRERARRAARNLNKPGNPASLNPDTRPDLWDGTRPDDRQCAFVGKVLGRRCKKWTVRGATRCEKHGGLREVPDHTGNGRLWIKGLVEDQEQHRQARDQVARMDKRQRAEAERAAFTAGIPRTPRNILEAVRALEADDGGRAWRALVQREGGRAVRGTGISGTGQQGKGITV